jgi:transposase-like protein
MDKHSLQLLLAQGMSVERIAVRFGKDPSTISYWLEKYGLRSPFAAKHAAKGALERQQLEECVQSGMTIAEIAEAVGRSKTTVRHWLRRYGLRTSSRRGGKMEPRAATAKAAGLLSVTLSCHRHGETEFSIEGRGYYRCKRCRVEAISRRRRKMKQTLVDEAGGGCRLCGYSGCLGALEFHHLDPLQKRIEINANGTSLALDTLREEARKCVLLCSNCHAEVEAGVKEVPARVAA